jgi:translation elongation factor EF-Ts
LDRRYDIHKKFWSETLKRKGHLSDLVVDDGITVKQMLKELDATVFGYVRLRMGFGKEILTQ